MNLLFTSAGRRVVLIQAFREALEPGGRALATDCDRTAPALYAADESFLSPHAADPGYLPHLMARVRRHRIRAIIPLIDPEIPLLAGAAPAFAALGCTVLTMSPSSVAIAADKWETARFFERTGIPTPATALPPLPPGFPFPVIVKPRAGSSSQGVVVCHTPEEVDAACRRTADPVLQQYVSGEEITIDVLGDLNGQVISAVQRRRLKVRAGEVERGVTIRDPEVERLAVRAAEALGPVGCINLQCIRTPEGPLFTEVNARFGGGYPLAQAAGADYPALIIRALRGEPLAPSVGAYETGVLMLRYDSAVILREEEMLRD